MDISTLSIAGMALMGVILIACSISYYTAMNKLKKAEIENAEKINLLKQRMKKYSDVLSLQLQATSNVLPALSMARKQLLVQDPMAYEIIHLYYRYIHLFIVKDLNAVVEGKGVEAHPVVSQVYTMALEVADRYLLKARGGSTGETRHLDFSVHGLERQRGFHLAALINNIVMSEVNTANEIEVEDELVV
jgi:hypothetical protein